MSMTSDTRSYAPPSSDYTGGPLFSGIDIFAGLLAIIMILGPMAAGAMHANPRGWDTPQRERGMH